MKIIGTTGSELYKNRSMSEMSLFYVYPCGGSSSSSSCIDHQPFESSAVSLESKEDGRLVRTQ